MVIDTPMTYNHTDKKKIKIILNKYHVNVIILDGLVRVNYNLSPVVWSFHSLVVQLSGLL